MGTFEVAVGSDQSVYVTTPTSVLAFTWNGGTTSFTTPPRTITPPTSGSGSALINPEGIAVSPDGTQIAVAYDGDGNVGTAGVAIYPASASGPTTPARIVGQPAGASLNRCPHGVRGVAWDTSGTIYVASCGFSGAATPWPASSGNMEVWAFPSTAAITDVPSRIIGPFTGWAEFTHIGIVASSLAVTGSSSEGRPVVFVPLGSSGTGTFTSSDRMLPTINPNFGFTADAAGWMFVSSFDTPGKLMAFAPGSRGRTAPVEILSSGVPHSVLGFDPVDGSVIAVEWGGGCCWNGTRDTSAATAEIRRISVGGALPTPPPPPPASTPVTPPPSSSPPSTPSSGSVPAASSDAGSAAPTLTTPTTDTLSTTSDSANTAQPEPAVMPAVTSSSSLASAVGLRLIARGPTGRTCLGAQCVTGRRWALQMCLPNEASISVQRRTARRWTALPARQINVAPLNCPAPTRSVTVGVPRRPAAGVFRVLMKIEGAPSLLSGLRVT